MNGVEIRDYVKNGTPYLRIGDLKLLEITKNSIVYVDDKIADSLKSKVKLQEGDERAVTHYTQLF